MNRVTRRQFCRSAGAALLLAPFFDLLDGTSPRQAHAAPTAGPRRVIFFFCPNGTIPRLWRPSGTETSFTFPPGSILEPLAPYQKDIIVCDGIDFIGVNNHAPGMAAMLTGGGDLNSPSRGMSVDQYIAATLGKNTRFPSLELGVQTSAWGGNVQTRMSYADASTFVTPEDSPVAAWNRLFAAAAPGGDAARLLRRRKSTLDLIRAEIGDLRPRLGAHERAKLDQHLDALRQTEQSLTGPTGCAAPPLPAPVDNYDYKNFPAVGKAQMDLLLAALACGMTNVASIQWAHTVAPTLFSWTFASEGHHDLSHIDDSNSAGIQMFVACERWFAQQFAYLLSALHATPDPAGGTLFDSTLVVWSKEMGDSRLHICQSVPWVLAGGGGYFRTGRYLQSQSAPHQQLLTSICNAMGLTNSSFGDAAKGSGPLPNLR